MVFLILFKLLIFWTILIFFAWQILRLIFKREPLELLMTYAGIAGPVFYIFCLNFLGHFFSIGSLFYSVIISFLLLAIILYFFNRAQEEYFWLLEFRWRKIFFMTVVAIFFTTGLIASRGVAGDEINLFSTVPMAGTIAEGNFPVRWTVHPQVMAYYHYGIELFSAAMLKTTGLPIWCAVDLCRAIFTALFLSVIFLLIFKVTRDPRKTYFASLMTLFGGGLVFINIFPGLIGLYKKFILGQDISAPWKFLHQATTAGVAGPLIKDVHIQWGAISFLLMVAGIFLYFKAAEYREQKKNWLGVVLINIIFLSVLALVGETFLLVELGIFLLYPFCALLIKSQKKYFFSYLLISFILVAVVALVAVRQGGVLTELFRQSYDRHPRLSSNWFYFSYEKVGYLWSAKSLINFGLPLFLILPAIYWLYFRERREVYNGDILQLTAFSLGCFAVPFVIELGPIYDYEMARYLYLAPPFWSLVIGLALADFIFDRKPKRNRNIVRFLSYAAVILITGGGLLFQLIFMIVPLGRSNERFTPFFFSYPAPSSLEKGAYEWLKKNTTIDDYLWSYSASDVYNIYNKKVNIFAGRIAPNYSYMKNHKMLNRDQSVNELIVFFDSLEKTCSPDALKFLNYRYLLVNQYWPENLEQICLNKSRLVLRYEAGDGGQFIRIYQIN